MNKFANSIIKYRVLIIVLFLITAVISFTFIDDVNTNYDNAKYLPAESIATKDLNTVTDSINIPYTISVMVNEINESEIESVISKIEAIDQIDYVAFDASNISQYKDNHALFTVFIKQDTEDIGSLINTIESELSDYDLSFGGYVATTYYQEELILQETPIILLIGGIVILIILILTTRSYLEPLVFGFIIGLAVIINMGTNIIFPEISYVTKSVAAILQLGLSMDYSIILLNSYYFEKEKTNDNKEAMINAIKNSFSSIISSSLTTVIGLLALLFMTCTIGMDIGLVLAKGIIISLISILLLLPNFILFIEKLPFNKYHKTLSISILSVKKSSKKFSIIMTMITILFICSMFYVQTLTNYTFTDKTVYEGQQEIIEVFKETNTFVIGIENTDDLNQNEIDIMNKINENYSENIVSYLGESNSSQMLIDYSFLNTLTTEDKSKVIFALYAINDGETNNITYNEYISTLEYLISTNEITVTTELSDFVKVIKIKNMLNSNYNQTDLLSELKSNGLIEDSNDNDELFKTVYNLYYLDNDLIDNSNITTTQYLTTILAMQDNGITLESDDLISLTNLNTQLNTIDTTLNSEVSNEEFRSVALNTFGITLDEATVTSIYDGYFTSTGLEVTTNIQTRLILNYIVTNELLDAEDLQTINAVLSANILSNTEVPYSNINTNINQIVYCLTGTLGTSNTEDNINKIVYVNTLSVLGRIPTTDVPFISFMNYTQNLITTSPFDTLINTELSISLNSSFTQMFLLQSDIEYNQTELINLISPVNNDKLNYLTNTIYAIDLSKTDFILNYKVKSSNLLNYLVTTKDIELGTEELYSLTEASNKLSTISNIVSNDDISLLVLNTNFAFESSETSEFIDFLYGDVLEDVDDNTYLIGFSVCTEEIKRYFQQDLLKINFITIGAILIVLTIAFRSFIIPAILVFIIEGAIWTTLSFSYFTGEHIFFMSYIIIGAIQLGATIDYAIVLTNNYRSLRKQLDPKKALIASMKKATPPILTSGVILISTGFAISSVSTLDTIVSIGSTIGRGTIISVIFVLTLLPSFLFTFDKFIIKNKKDNS